MFTVQVKELKIKGIKPGGNPRVPLCTVTSLLESRGSLKKGIRAGESQLLETCALLLNPTKER